MKGMLDAIAHLVVRDGVVECFGPEVPTELGCDSADALLGPLDQIGVRLDNTTFDELCRGEAPLRVRLGAELSDRPVRLRRLGVGEDSRIWLEIRSLAHEFRLESLLRRSGMGHMLLSPNIELIWSMSANDLSDMFPGDNPLNWVELMDPDDMQALGKAIYKVGQDPSLRKTVRHRLEADRTYTIIDTVESAIHDPDLRAVLVRSQLEDAVASKGVTAPYAGITVSDHMTIGVVVAGTTGKVLHRNAAAAELIGAKAGQAVVPNGEEPSMIDHLPGEYSARFQTVFAAAVDGKPSHCTIPSPSNSSRWLRVAVSPAAASTVVMTIEDMTELAEAERAFRASNRLLEALDSHSEELVVVFDAQGRARYTSSSIRRHFGPDTRIDHADDFMAHVIPADRPIVENLRRCVGASGSSSGVVELRVGSDEATARWHHATMTNLLDDDDVQGLVLTVRDVHARHVMERDLRFWATHDALTTLPDRAALRTRLEAVLEEAEVGGDHTALVFCDIDNFKQINDQHGHHFGDLVLTEVAKRLQDSMRSDDFVGRFGGDEFVIVVPNVENSEHAVSLAERVFLGVVGPAIFGSAVVDISLSMGVALTDRNCTTFDALLQRADQAMYQSKRLGRRRLTLYSPDVQARISPGVSR